MTELNQEMPKVLVRGLKKQYGNNVVLKSIDLTVNQGEVVCVIGPSGSGKSTMLRCLNRMEEINGGKVFVDGVDITDPKEDINKIRQNIGMVFQHFNLFPHLSVLDNITLAPMELKGLSKVEAESLALYLLESVGLADKAKTRLDKLSGGQQQKVQLGITIINDPELIILDEPTKGFDPVNRRLLMEIIEEHQAKGATVVMITHQMDEVERLCDRILLLKDGVAHAYGTIDEVRTQFGGKSLDDIFIQVYSQPSKEDN